MKNLVTTKILMARLGLGRIALINEVKERRDREMLRNYL